MKANTIIKCYDLPGNEECFTIAKVVREDLDRLHCVILKRVFAGKEVPVTDFGMVVPKLGFHFMDNTRGGGGRIVTLTDY